MLDCCKSRPIRFGRWGLAEDPVGYIVKCNGELYEVTGTYRKARYSLVTMLIVKHFNGEPAPDLAAGAVLVIADHYHDDSE